jgi:thiamine-monophosphate kinase
VHRLGDVGEQAWIARLTRRLARSSRGDRRVLVGPGDDAAAVRPEGRPLLLTTDTLVEGVHFRRGWASPGALGRRAFAVNASDVAAMGGRPAFVLLALEAPASLPTADLDALVDGVAAAARGAGARLVGGNLSAGPCLAVTVALVGTVPGRLVTRAGARPGDRLWLTGTLGAAGLGVRRGRLAGVPRRTGAGMLLARVASAMIDVSDGLVQDLGHLCRASGVGAALELPRLPVAPAVRRALGARAARFAATAGEDYELLAAVPPVRERTLARLRGRLGCRLTCIGRIVAGPPAVRVLDARGRQVRLGRGGFDHFAGRASVGPRA